MTTQKLPNFFFRKIRLTLAAMEDFHDFQIILDVDGFLKEIEYENRLPDGWYFLNKKHFRMDWTFYEGRKPTPDEIETFYQ